MKALMREFAPTVVFAGIVITMMSMTLNILTKHIQEGGVQHEQVIGKLNLIEYRLGEIEVDVKEHINDDSIHVQRYSYKVKEEY